MEKITEYVRKSHSFTKEALDHLGILNKYMGDIGESAVLRYLIANEIRKVPNPRNYGQVHAGITEEGLQAVLQGQLEHLTDKSKEEELAKLRQVVLINRLIGKSFDGHKAAEAEIKGFDADAVSHALWGDDE